MEPEVIAAIIGAAGTVTAAIVTVVWVRRSSNRTGGSPESSADGPSPDGPESGYEVHTVQPGDTLWIIAEQYYDGDGSRYSTILEANPQIESDNQVLYPGQKLRVPKTPDG